MTLLQNATAAPGMSNLCTCIFKVFHSFPLCEFTGNTHYLPSCHNMVFAVCVMSALVIQEPLFS